MAEALARGETIVVSSIVLFELSYGIAKSTRHEHNRAKLAQFTSGLIESLDFDSGDADEAGEIRAALERVGTPIGYYDVLIAGQARRRDALLVTANTREFTRVPGLKVEDWSTR
jgi:tRNA(fMet)-specific endonuclease VapC